MRILLRLSIILASASLLAACAASNSSVVSNERYQKELSKADLKGRIAPVFATSPQPSDQGVTVAVSTEAAGDGSWLIRGSGDFYSPVEGAPYFELYPQGSLHSPIADRVKMPPNMWDLPAPPKILRIEVREDWLVHERVAKELSFATPIQAGSLVALTYRGGEQNVASVLVIPPAAEADQGFVQQIAEPPLESRAGELILTCRADQRSEYSVVAMEKGVERTLLVGYRNFFPSQIPWTSYIHLRVTFPDDLSDDASIRVISHFNDAAVDVPLREIRLNHVDGWQRSFKGFRTSAGRIVFPAEQ